MKRLCALGLLAIAAGAMAGDAEPGVTRKDDGQNLQEFIRAASLDYLERRASGDFEGAYRMLSTEMQGFVPFGKWSAQNEAANRETGKLKDMEVWRVTVYDRPANAPRPGIYVAADYEGTYRKGAIHCGYLIWFGVSDRQFAITREETGYLQPEVLASLEPERAREFRRQMKCKP